MIGRNTQVRRTVFDHPKHRSQHAPDGTDFLATRVLRGRYREEVPEQFISAVDQVDVHPVCCVRLAGRLHFLLRGDVFDCQKRRRLARCSLKPPRVDEERFTTDAREIVLDLQVIDPARRA